MAADSVARGLALAALGQYNKLIKVKGFTITGTEDEWGPDLHKDPAITEKEKVRLKVNYEYWETETGPKTSSYFKIEQGRGIHYYGLNIGDRVPNTPTTAHQGQYKDEHGNWLGYDATQYYYIVQYIDGSYREFEVPILSPSFKKIILDWATHHGILPDPATAEDNAIYFLEQEPKPGKTEGTYLLYVRTLDKSKTPHQWQWTNIGSTEFDLSEYQKKIDTLIKFKTTNYDPATKGAKPVIENVVGSANQALASIGPIITGDTYTLYTAKWRNEVTETVSLPTGLWVEPVAPATEYTIKLSTRLDPTTTPTTTIPGVTVARTGVNEVTFSAATKPTTELIGTLTYGVSDTVQTVSLSEYTSDIRLDDSRFSVAWNNKDVKEFIVKLNDPTQVPTTDVVCGSTQLHIDFSKDISDLGLRTQILKTLDPTFTKRSDIITALNEHERELMFVYDYATAKINTTASGLHGYIYDGNPERKTEQTEPLANHSGHNKDVRSILKSIGDMANLKYIPYTIDSDPTKRNPYCDYTIPASPKPITGHEIDAICWELDNYKWTLVDAINAAKTRYDADLRATANVNQYSTYDIKGENELYDKEKEDRDHPAETKNETFTVKRDEIVCRKRKRKSGATGEEIGIYEITYNLGHTYIESKGDFTFTQTVSTTVPVTIIGLSESIVKFQIGDDTTPYVLPPTTTELGTITVTYTGQDQDRYGRIDIPAIKIRKESEIDHDEVKGEDDQHGIQKSGWYYYEETYGDPPVVHKGLIYYVELKYSAVGKDDGTGKQHEVIDPDYPITYQYCTDPSAATPTWVDGLPTDVEAIWNPQAKDYDQGVGKNIVILVYKRGETPIPTVGPDYFALRVNYWKPSNTSSRYYLEYEGHPYSFALSGDKIEIEKDKFLKDVSVKTCEVKDKPIPGLNVGDKYLDFEFWLEDGTTKHAYIICKDLGIPIIDTDALPTQNIQENFFYRTRDISEVVERYALKDQAIIDGYKLTHNGLYIPGTTPQTIPLTDPTLPNYIDPDPTAPDPTKPIEIDTHGPLSKVSDGKATPTYTYKFDYNQSPVTLQFHDEKSEENHKWVDMISKYRVVNTFVQDDTTTPWTLVKGDAWQLYVLLTEDHGYEPGIYIWDINDYRAISSESEAILDVTTLPVAPMIEENVFYRTKTKYETLNRYDLSAAQKAGGAHLFYDKIRLINGDEFDYTQVQGLIDAGDVVEVADGPISKITNDGGTTTSFTYKFINPVNSLQYHTDDYWTDVIAKNKVVSELPSTDQSTTENYVILEDWVDTSVTPNITYIAGEYIWDGAAWQRIATNTEKPILDEKPYINANDEINYLNEYFFRGKNEYTIDAIYGITPEAVEAGYIVTPTGLTLPDATSKTWEEVLTDWATYYDPADPTKPIVDNNKGNIFKVTDTAGTTLIYNYNSTPITLEFWDNDKHEYIEVISKYEGVNTFDDGTGALQEGKEYQFYVLLNNCTVGTEVYEKGIYIWNGKDYILATSNVKPIIDVEVLPTKEIKEDCFYRTHDYTEINKRYKLSNTAKEAGYTCDFKGVTKNDPTTPVLTTWADVLNNEADWFTPAAGATEALIIEDTHGDIFKICKDPSMIPQTYELYYNFNTSPVTLQFYDPILNDWTEVISKYKAINTFEDTTSTEALHLVKGYEWQIYVLLNDCKVPYEDTTLEPKLYKAGTYIWDRTDYVSITGNADAIIDVEELPTSYIEDNRFYRTKSEDETLERYDLIEAQKLLGAYLTNDTIYLEKEDGSGMETKTYSNTDVDALLAETTPRIEVSVSGPISKISNDGGTTYRYEYKFINPVNSLQYHTNDYWTDVIAKNKVVKTLPTTGQSTTENYVLLEDWVDTSVAPNITYIAGEYIWDGKVWQRTATNTEKPILDEKPIVRVDNSNPLNEYFFRDYDIHQVLDIYSLTPEAIQLGWTAGEQGLTQPDGTIILWGDVDPTVQPIIKNNKGDIFEVVYGPMGTEFVYNYNSSPIKLEFWDEIKKEYVEVISKFDGVTHFVEDYTTTPLTLIEGRQWQLYVLLNDELHPTTKEILYRRGIYIWNGKDYVRADSSVRPIIDVEALPVKAIEEDCFYRTYDDRVIIGRYKLSDAGKALGYTYDFRGIVDSSVIPFTIYTWEEVNNDWTTWTQPIDPTDPSSEGIIIQDDDNGNIYRTSKNPLEATPVYETHYNFNTSPSTLQFHNTHTNTATGVTESEWIDVISKYIAVNTFTDEHGNLILHADDSRYQNEWQIYVLLNDTPKYKKGTYIWDRYNYVAISSDGIIDVEVLPTTNIVDNRFYRTKTFYETIERYDLTEVQKLLGAYLTYEWIYLIDDTGNKEVRPYSDVDALLAEATPRIEISTNNGPISKISRNGGITYDYTYKYINPVNSLYYHTDDYWTDVIAKNKVVNNFSEAEIPTADRSTTENYVLLEDWVDTSVTPNITYIAGEYIWDGKVWQRIATNIEKPILDEKPIIRVDNINYLNEYFFRGKNEYTIDAIYGITPEAVEAGYIVTPTGLTLPDATSKTWEEVLTDWATYYDPADPTKPIVDNNKGNIFKVTDVVDTTLIYNYNSSPISLEFWDDSKKEYIEIISKYEGVTTFDDGTGALNPGREYQIYILLNNCTVGTEVYEKGIYIWNGKDYILAADNVKPIIDVEKLPTKEIKEDCFYRTHDITEIDKRYKLSNTALTAGYTCDFQGVTDSVGTLTTWADVLNNEADWFTPAAGATEALIIEDTHGDIFKICKDPSMIPQTYELYYNFNTSPVTLQFYDPILNDWTEVISKYIAINTFTKADGTLIPHADDSRYQNEWQIYVLLNDTPNYKKGTYIWDRTDYVSITGDTDAIIDVDTLPTLEIEENKFYRTHDDAIIRTRYKLSDGAIEEGYSLTPDGIKLGVGTGSTLTDWTTVTANINDWINPETGKTYPRMEQDLVHGPIYMVNPFPAVPAAKSLYYNFNTSPTSLQFHDLKTNDWIEMISKYEAVNTFFETTGTPPTRTLKTGKEWQIYMLLNDDIDPNTEEVLYKKGIYIWDRASETATQAGDYIAVSSITDCIIVVDTLPTLNINSKAVYELRTTNTLPTIECYKIAATEPATTTLDIYGLHYEDATVTPPEMKTVCFADLFLNWTTYSTRFELDVADPPTGKIWKITDGTNTEFRWSDTKPSYPEKRTQFYVYNEDTSEWKLLADDNNSINGVYNHNEGRQTSESLEIIWEGSKTDYEALTKINPSTLYLVHNGEGKGPAISYNTLDDRPMINHVLLQGDTTLQELGLTAFLFKSTVATVADLPATGNEQGDLYYVSTPKEFWAWNGTTWKLAGTDLADFSKYQLKHDETLKTTEKDIVPAINELYDSMTVPEALTITYSGSGGILKGRAWYTSATKQINFSIALSGLNITEEKENFTVGTFTFTSPTAGAVTPEFNQAIASCDLDGKVSTNIFIAPDGSIKANIYMGHHTFSDTTYPNSYYTEGFTLNQLSISGTIFCN